MLHRRIAMLLGATLVLAGCQESYRVEPLLLENQQLMSQTIAGYDDAGRIDIARQAAVSFAKAYEDGRCDEAWVVLTPRYRAAFATTAGGEAEARQQFCDGYRVKGDMLVKGDWPALVLGPSPHYITSVPPELEVQSAKGRELYFVVQKDGSYTSFLLMDEGENRHIEPF